MARKKSGKITKRKIAIGASLSTLIAIAALIWFLVRYKWDAFLRAALPWIFGPFLIGAVILWFMHHTGKVTLRKFFKKFLY